MPTFDGVISAKKNLHFLVKGIKYALDIGSPNRNYHFIWGAKKKLQSNIYRQQQKLISDFRWS